MTEQSGRTDQEVAIPRRVLNSAMTCWLYELRSLTAITRPHVRSCAAPAFGPPYLWWTQDRDWQRRDPPQDPGSAVHHRASRRDPPRRGSSSPRDLGG